VRDEAARHGIEELEIVEVDGSVILGEVFNRGFEAATGDYVGKMDDDDYYGPEYAADLIDAFRYTEADIVGKWAHYAYLGSLDAMILRYGEGEHSYQPVVAISTLVMRRSVLDEVHFPAMPAGSGSLFLRKAGASGARVYSADRFNYLYVRGTDSDRHTWSFTDYELTAKSDFVCQGRNIDHVVV
jgi:glycosyltransferase involved in cell wall biosynthesis